MTEIKERHKDLLEKFLNKDQMQDFEIGSDLSGEQKIAFEKFKKGENICILGSAGCGKSFFIKTIQKYNLQFDREPDYKKMYLTSLTGVSAYSINGMTIHSFLGLGIGSLDIYSLIKKIKKSQGIVDRIKSPHILVIDEISMLSASLFEKIVLIYRHFRKTKELDVQFILTGDLLQIECIFNKFNETNASEPLDTRLLIASDVFNSLFPKPIKFICNFRQKGDSSFFDLLSRIRVNRLTEDDTKLLENKVNNFNNELNDIKKEGIIPLHLVISNAKAQAINKINLDKINSNYVTYNHSVNTVGSNYETINILKKELEKQFTVKGLLKLELKVGARIMLLKNLSVDSGLINGATGTIIQLHKLEITVKFDNGMTSNIAKADFELELDSCKVRFTQLPVICAYSLTISKSQSLTLGPTIMDLEDIFCNHMGYVALSRVKSLDHLLLKSFNRNKITVNNNVINFLENIK